MISKHFKISTSVTCETEVVGTRTYAATWNSFHYSIPLIFWDKFLVFYFQTEYFCFLNGTNSTVNVKTNRTANTDDGVKIGGCKVNLIYFLNYWWNCTVKVCHVKRVNKRIEVNQIFIKDGTELPFIQGLPHLYTTHNHSFTTHIPRSVWV